jgi:peptidoglycan/LPS O-acetylase OafA/YrhL
MRSLQTQLTSVHGHPTGFDYLRLLLALSVIVWHSVLVCYGEVAESSFWTGPLRAPLLLILPAFFALSGFLVAGSLERNSIPEFLALRVLRIFPALAVEVFISALLIGPLVTVLPLRRYFFSAGLSVYFLNTIGLIQYHLPGVFGDLPTPDVVNAQLWTVPYELYCYAILTALTLSGFAKQSTWLFTLTFAGVLLLTALSQSGRLNALHYGPDSKLLIFSFLFGVSLYVMRDQTPFSCSLFFISIAAFATFVMNVKFIYLSALPLAYLTVFLGSLNPAKTLLVRGADYSYGIYLYGFPLQQAVCFLLPSLRDWRLNALLGVTFAFVCAALSWTFVESPILSRRRRVVSWISSRLEGMTLAVRGCLRFKSSTRTPLEAEKGA